MHETNASRGTFMPLPLVAIKPLGWLRDQLRVQAAGLSGHLARFWPYVARSRWIGGDSEGWERGPYWLDGAVPLALLLGDEALTQTVSEWFDYILTHQHADGWLGPREDPHAGSGERTLDPWPQFVLFKAMLQWRQATGDPRIVPAMFRAARRIDLLLDEIPLTSWAGMRWPDLLVGLLWLYGETGEPWLLSLAQKAQRQGYDWRRHFEDFRYKVKQPRWLLENHVVNHAMALKEPAVRFGLTGDPSEAAWADRYIATLDEHHGQVTGVFSGDESLAGTSPSQGTELCAVVEYLYSLELLLAAFGTPALGDRLERIAFNALPATFTADMWAHQYVQQVNQVVCKLAPDGERVYTNNGPDANIYGLEPNFGCCTANMHQGWPKLASHLWMRAAGGGFAAVAYAPCEVRAEVNGASVTIVTETEYPFRPEVHLRVAVDRAARFPLLLRVPGWASEATVAFAGEPAERAQPGTFHRIERTWRDGDRVNLTLPMAARVEPTRSGGVSVHRGPLLFGLRIGEEFRYLRGEAPHADYEVFPTTPWNYGLALTAAAPKHALALRERPIGPTPFAPDSAPVTVLAPARRVPEWTLQHNAAGPLPAGPLGEDQPVETVELLPYGSTHLRVADFPVVKP